MEPQEPTGRIALAEIRERLVERGYLGGPIERYVLRDLVGRGPDHPSGLFAALRAALIGAPLLAALLALVVGTTNRPRLSTLDTSLLWLYFTPVSAVALGLIYAVVVGLSTALSTRRRGPATHRLRAGLLVAVPLLAYLVLIWSWRGAGESWLADVAFACGAAISVAGVAWLAGLVSLAAVIGSTGTIPDRRRRSAGFALAAMVSIFIAGLGLQTTIERTPADAPPPAFTVVPHTSRLIFVGIDGLDASLVAEIGDRGMLPNLVARLERASVYPLTRPDSREPAEVWTTLLSGTTSAEHHVVAADSARLPGLSSTLSAPPHGGVQDAVRALLPVRPFPTSGIKRGVRMAWEILGLRRPVLAVGWWATWPALPDPAAGALTLVITDRALPKLLAGVDADRDTWPESLFPRLAGELPGDLQAIESRLVETLARIDAATHRHFLRESYLIDAWNVRIARRVWGQTGVDAAFVYLPGLDVLRTRLRKERTPTGDADRAIGVYVQALDGLLAEMLASASGVEPDWVLVGDPGRSGAGDGFVAENGPRTRGGCVGPRIDWLDVTPLVLDRSGFPSADDLKGVTPFACARSIPRIRPRVASFGRRAVGDSPATSAFDPELIERLRSLGYLN